MATKKRRVAGPGRLGSIAAVKNSAKAGGNKHVRNIASEKSLTVRFLEEPSEWFGFYQHFEKPEGYFPCTGDDCRGCLNPSDDGSKSFRYLANAYVVDDSKVMAVMMPKSLVEQLLAYYDKYDTILDRDYDLSKTGSGKEGTKYMASPDSPSKMKTSRFKLLDLDDVLESMIVGDDDDDDDDDEPPRKKKSSSASKKSRRTSDDEDDDPWDDDDDEDDEDEEDERPRKKKASKSKPTKKVTGKKVVKKSSTTSKAVRKPSRKSR
jgi:hypothetical protein